MPDGVMAAVEQMAAEQEQQIFDRDGPKFEWSPGFLITEQDEIDLAIEEDIEYVEDQNEMFDKNFDEVSEENEDVDTIDEVHEISEKESSSENENFIDANSRNNTDDEDYNIGNENDTSNDDSDVY